LKVSNLILVFDCRCYERRSLKVASRFKISPTLIIDDSSTVL
jgi:hypothetical protein